MMPTDTGIPIPKTDTLPPPPLPCRTHPSAIAWSASCPLTPPGSPASARPPVASEPRLHSGGAALPTGRQGKGPTRGRQVRSLLLGPTRDQETKSGGGGRKLIPRRRGAQAPCPLHSGPSPSPGPPAPGAGTHPKPPSSCRLALPHRSGPLGEGASRPASHSRTAAHFWAVGVRVPHLHGATWLHPPLGLLHQSPFRDQLGLPARSGGFSGSGFTSP